MHPRRQIKAIRGGRTADDEFTCFSCNQVFIGQRYVYGSVVDNSTHSGTKRILYLCGRCKDNANKEDLEKAREEIRLRSLRMVDKYSSALQECQTHGTCDILKAHHELLINDPERLETDFLIGQVFGEGERQLWIKTRGGSVPTS